MDRGKPTLESLPTEIQLAILRHFLYFTKGHIVLTPCFQNCSRRQRFTYGELALPGISGIMRASKHLSNLALGVLYGENVFLVCEDHYDFTDSENSDFDGEELTPSAVPDAQGHEEFPMEQPEKSHQRETQVSVVSRVSGPDVAKNTRTNHATQVGHKSGYDRHDADIDGVLPRILRRLRGLQHIEFRLSYGWDTYVATPSRDGYARFGQGFLQLVKRELGHVKTVLIDEDETIDGDEDFSVSSGWPSSF